MGQIDATIIGRPFVVSLFRRSGAIVFKLRIETSSEVDNFVNLSRKKYYEAKLDEQVTTTSYTDVLHLKRILRDFFDFFFKKKSNISMSVKGCSSVQEI